MAQMSVAVVETRTVPEVYKDSCAVLAKCQANVHFMTASLSDVTSGSVTLAVRDTTIDGLEIP